MTDHDTSYTLATWPVTRWLTDVGPDVPLDIRARLIAGFFTSTKSLVIGALANIAVILVAVIRHPTMLFIALLAIDVTFLLCRLTVLTISHRAVERNRRTLTNALIAFGLLWTALVGVGTMVCVGSGDTVLLFLGPSTMLGIVSGLVTRNSGAPRFAVAQIIFCSMPMNLAIPFVGQPWMFVGTVHSILLVIAMTGTVHRLNQRYLTALIAEKDSKRRANHDILTGALNRAGAMAALSRGVTEAVRQASSLAVFYLDLDGFKAVNDGFGHAAGDALLVLVTGRIAQGLPETWMLGRLGGDEFVIVAPGCDAAQAATTGGALVAALGSPFQLSTCVEVRIGVSMGVAFAAPETTAEELLAEADAALYRAKTGGKGRCLIAPRRPTSTRLAA